jgi:putative SOS response-associated peptidase YedK
MTKADKSNLKHIHERKAIVLNDIINASTEYWKNIYRATYDELDMMERVIRENVCTKKSLISKRG